MTGPEMLIERLAPVAAQHGFTQVWRKDTLRLENGDGTAGTVVCFPTGFWERFADAEQAAQENALDSIRLSVALQYRRHSGPMAHVVDVHMSYLEGA